jgi:hypothetical protein
MDQVIGEQKPEKRDVSRQTLVVLVVLAVVVSLLGTFTVLRETSGANVGTKQMVINNEGSQSAQGKVSLTIVPAGTVVAPNTNGATGYVSLEIRPRS